MVLIFKHLYSTIDGGTKISTPSSILNNTAPAPGVRLRITTSTGEDISGTKLGQKLFLRIEMDRESIFGIFAKSLKAISGIEDDEIDLLDDRGCPTDPIIFPGLQKIPGSRDLQGSFEAFKFSDTSVVRFQVNVQFCVDECNPVECGDGITSYGRKKRSPDSFISQTLTVDLPTPDLPESVANRLVYDDHLGQEVLYSDTPLSKEIYVESGTKVDSYKEPHIKSSDNGGKGCPTPFHVLFTLIFQFSFGVQMKQRKLSAPPGQSLLLQVRRLSFSSFVSFLHVSFVYAQPEEASPNMIESLIITPFIVEVVHPLPIHHQQPFIMTNLHTGNK